ncbi:erythromycin esterase family protein [Nocardia sp. NBC_01329]|uniref:erythromycin esterase family protein n=1 Tax=Nocardia sp. NBC_01329 TaxID=2903594 RepID=UPI002E103845|nr:erythromycin esterase family protein [Nocardia sp. NBC_01329]
MTTTSTSTGTSEPVHEWLRSAAQPILGTDSTDTGPDLRKLTDRLATATVVGLGESTRFSRQTYGVRDRIFRALVTEHGFRTLAIQDNARSGARLDAYVRTGGDPLAALAGAWRPWRTGDAVATLEWIRAHNLEHPDDQVGIIGVQPPAAEPADYDDVLTYTRRWAPTRLAELESKLTPIRTAHRIDEHVQHHQGIHPGRPFAEDARDALALLKSLPRSADPGATAEFATALGLLRSIVDFHEHSVAGRGGFGGGEPAPAQTLIDHYEHTGARIVYWDGIAHTAATDPAVGGTAAARMRTEGSHLRARFGPAYRSVGIGFHHGDLGTTHAPVPHPELADATFGTVDLPAWFVVFGDEIPAEVRAWTSAPAQLRVISGIYDPARDEEARFRVESLRAAFDALIHIRETTPVHWLPETDAG